MAVEGSFPPYFLYAFKSSIIKGYPHKNIVAYKTSAAFPELNINLSLLIQSLVDGLTFKCFVNNVYKIGAELIEIPGCPDPVFVIISSAKFLITLIAF